MYLSMDQQAGFTTEDLYEDDNKSFVFKITLPEPRNITTNESESKFTIPDNIPIRTMNGSLLHIDPIFDNGVTLSRLEDFGSSYYFHILKKGYNNFTVSNHGAINDDSNINEYPFYGKEKLSANERIRSIKFYRDNMGNELNSSNVEFEKANKLCKKLIGKNLNELKLYGFMIYILSVKVPERIEYTFNNLDEEISKNAGIKTIENTLSRNIFRNISTQDRLVNLETIPYYPDCDEFGNEMIYGKRFSSLKYAIVLNNNGRLKQKISNWVSANPSMRVVYFNSTNPVQNYELIEGDIYFIKFKPLVPGTTKNTGIYIYPFGGGIKGIRSDNESLKLNTDNDRPVEFRTNDGRIVSLQEVFQSASEGKRRIADILTGKGIPTDTTTTWDDIANKLNQSEIVSSVEDYISDYNYIFKYEDISSEFVKTKVLDGPMINVKFKDIGYPNNIPSGNYMNLHVDNQSNSARMEISESRVFDIVDGKLYTLFHVGERRSEYNIDGDSIIGNIFTPILLKIDMKTLKIEKIIPIQNIANYHRYGYRPTYSNYYIDSYKAVYLKKHSNELIIVFVCNTSKYYYNNRERGYVTGYKIISVDLRTFNIRVIKDIKKKYEDVLNDSDNYKYGLYYGGIGYNCNVYFTKEKLRYPDRVKYTAYDFNNVKLYEKEYQDPLSFSYNLWIIYNNKIIETPRESENINHNIVINEIDLKSKKIKPFEYDKNKLMYKPFCTNNGGHMNFVNFYKEPESGVVTVYVSESSGTNIQRRYKNSFLIKEDLDKDRSLIEAFFESTKLNEVRNSDDYYSTALFVTKSYAVICESNYIHIISDKHGYSFRIKLTHTDSTCYFTHNKETHSIEVLEVNSQNADRNSFNISIIKYKINIPVTKNYTLTRFPYGLIHKQVDFIYDKMNYRKINKEINMSNTSYINNDTPQPYIPGS